MKKRLISYIIIFAITALVIFFALKDNYVEIMDTIFSMNPFWIITAFLIMIIAWLVKSVPIHLFCKEYKKDYKYGSSIILVLRTQFANAVTPFATGGQPYQVYFLKKRGLPISTGTGIILQNFIVYQIPLVLLGVIAMISNSIFHFLPGNSILTNLTIIGFIINTLVVVFSFVLAFAKKFSKWLIKLAVNILYKFHFIKNKEEKLESWTKSTVNFHDSVIELTKNKKLFIGTILLNFLYLCLLYSIPLFILFATGDYTSLNLFSTIMISAFVMLIGSFVPIPGGTGGLEGAYMTFFGTVLTPAVTNSTMLIWRFITYFFGLIVGGIAFNITEKKDRKCE